MQCQKQDAEAVLNFRLVTGQSLLGKHAKNVEATRVHVEDFEAKDANLSKIRLCSPTEKTVTTLLLKGKLGSAGQHCSGFNKSLVF